MSSTVSGMATATGRWSTARFHAVRASSQCESSGVTKSPVSRWRSSSTEMEVASLLITFMGAMVWPPNLWSVGLPDEPGVVPEDDPVSSGALGALARAALGSSGLARRALASSGLARARLAGPRRPALLRRSAALGTRALARARRLLRRSAARAGPADVESLLDRVGSIAQIADHAAAKLLGVSARITFEIGKCLCNTLAQPRRPQIGDEVGVP